MNAEPASTISGPGAARPRNAADAFERLFMAEYGKVVAIAHRVLADKAEAEDVAQEVFLSFHRRHRPDASYAAPWLHTAAVHTALNRIRSRKRRERREARVEEPEQQDPQQLVEIGEERRRVRRALTRLNVKAASVLVLRYSGLSYAEVGSAVGVGAGQVGTLLRRAEQSLKKELNREPSV